MTITNSHTLWCSLKAARSCKQQPISKPTPRPTVRPSTKKPDLILVQQSNGTITLPDQVFLILINQWISQGELGPSKTSHSSCQHCQHYSRADQDLENLVVISVEQEEAVRPGKIVIGISIFVIINIIIFVIINITIFIKKHYHLHNHKHHHLLLSGTQDHLDLGQPLAPALAILVITRKFCFDVNCFRILCVTLQVSVLVFWAPALCKI